MGHDGEAVGFEAEGKSRGGQIGDGEEEEEEAAADAKAEEEEADTAAASEVVCWWKGFVGWIEGEILVLRIGARSLIDNL